MRRARSLAFTVAMLLLPACADVSAQPRFRGHVIGLLMVPELMPPDSCTPFPPAAVPLYPARGASTPIGELRGAGRSPSATVCEFPDVRAIVGRSSFEIATDEHAYEERSLIVTAATPGWYQVFTGGRPELVWMRPTARSVYRPLDRLYEDGLTYLRAEWDRRLYASPNGAFSELARLSAGDQHFEPMVKVDEVALVEGTYWARVTFIENLCDPEKPSGQGRGWVRVHGPQPSARPILWFHARGC